VETDLQVPVDHKVTKVRKVLLVTEDQLDLQDHKVHREKRVV
jgi:hypothetical protein